MFYSHEILASPQYGVATVWLVANLGHNAPNRKLTRKAIESVNVPRACNTIERPPGAPIALRLQGNLLYGVAGVYKKHGVYLLDDVEKMWARMRTFCRDMQNSASNKVDLNAGKAKRNQLVLDDDPNFVPESILPPLDFDENGDLILPGLEFSQGSNVYSQFSPLDSNNVSPVNAPFINLDIRHSSSQGSLAIASPFNRENQVRNDDDIMPIMFGEEDELPFEDFGLRIDADGNLMEEPELPAYPIPHIDGAGEPIQKTPSGIPQLPENERPIMPIDDDFQVIWGDDEQPPAVTRAPPIQQNEVPLPSEEPLSSDPADRQPPKQRKRRAKKTLAPDDVTYVGRMEFTGWSTNYLSRMKETNRGTHQVTTGQAKKNAYNLTFGMGLGGVGILNGIAGLNHELPEFFAGDNLKDIVMGDTEEAEERTRGGNRRRSASVAFGSEDGEGQSQRRVRSCVHGEQDAHQQTGRGQQDAQLVENSTMMFGDDRDLLPEIGRERPGSALSDHRRSSNAPWNRQSSAVPSSTGKNIETGRNIVNSSPHIGRSSLLQPADAKFSDRIMPVFDSDGFAPFQGDGVNDLSSYGDLGTVAGVPTKEATTSQLMRDALDREGRDFLGFMEQAAADRGDEDADDENLRWVKFDDLFEEQDKTRLVTTQAFLHVLTLATKSQIKVTQQGAEEGIPFGEIQIGVKGPFQENPRDDEKGDAAEEMEVEEPAGVME